jgi:hypothetical protein
MRCSITLWQYAKKARITFGAVAKSNRSPSHIKPSKNTTFRTILRQSCAIFVEICRFAICGLILKICGFAIAE